MSKTQEQTVCVELTVDPKEADPAELVQAIKTGAVGGAQRNGGSVRDVRFWGEQD